MSSLDLIWDSLPIKEKVDVLRHEQLDIIRRVGRMERKHRPNVCQMLIGIALEIASPKEWIVGTIVLILFMKGIMSAADIKSIFLSAHGSE